MIELVSDCARCHGLCCVALPMSESADFPVSKAAGVACRHLSGDDRCTIHHRLRQEGWPGCVTFECFGAGQYVSQVHYRGRSWRDGATVAEEMFAVFVVQHRLHELLVYLDQAIAAGADARARGLRRQIQGLCSGPPASVRDLDLDRLRAQVAPVLRSVSAEYRVSAGPGLRKAQLLGADLRGADLECADLSGALLIGADLRRANLRRADVLGTDLREADLRGACLAETLFLVQPQVNSARGDASTVLPDQVTRPGHWIT